MRNHAEEGHHTIPDVVRLFADYKQKPGNGVWGSLHVALDDGNVSNADISRCIEHAEERFDVDGVKLGRILLTLSRTQRQALPAAVDREIERRAAETQARDGIRP